MESRYFWVKMTEPGEDGNPECVCWAYYEGDRPSKESGYWIKVQEILPTIENYIMTPKVDNL